MPSILIERTEIVTGGASAAYGSDAITGVVNVILDDNLEGLQLFARINNLLDKDPPIVPEFQFPTNPVYFNTIGRYFTFGVRARF